jgi:hypothetical protein
MIADEDEEELADAAANDAEDEAGGYCTSCDRCIVSGVAVAGVATPTLVGLECAIIGVALLSPFSILLCSLASFRALALRRTSLIGWLPSVGWRSDRRGEGDTEMGRKEERGEGAGVLW